MTQPKINEEGASSWYLRTEDQEVYGPIPLVDLQAWAEEGRIAPEHQLSRDQSIWVSAESIPELHMEWVAETPDGQTFGPFPQAALTDFLNLGVIPPESTVRNRRTGDTSTIGHLVDPLLTTLAVAAPSPSTEESAASRVEIDTLRRQLASVTAERNAAVTSLTRLETSLRQHESDKQIREGRNADAIAKLDAQLKQTQAAVEQGRQREAALAREQADLTKKLSDALHQIDLNRKRETTLAEEIQRKETEWNQRLTSLEAGLTTKEKDLLARHRELEVKLAEAAKQFSDEKLARTADQQQADQQERVLVNRIAELEKQLQQARDDVRGAEAKQGAVAQQKDVEWTGRLAQAEAGLNAKLSDLLASRRDVETKLTEALTALTEHRGQRMAEAKVAAEKSQLDAARITELERQLAAVRAEAVRVEEQRKQLDVQKEADWAARVTQFESRLADKDGDIQAVRAEMEARLADLQRQLDQAGEQQAASAAEVENQRAATRREHDQLVEQRLELERRFALATSEWTNRESRLVEETAQDKQTILDAQRQAELLQAEIDRLHAESEAQRLAATRREKEIEARWHEAVGQVEAAAAKAREQDAVIQTSRVREKELTAQVEQLEISLAKARSDAEAQARKEQALQEELAHRDARIAAQQMQARSLLFEEVSQREQELAQEEKLTLSVQSALQRRKDNLKRYMASLEKLVEGPFETQKEMFEQQQAALEKLPLIEAELEKARMAEREAQDRALRIGSESQSAIEQLREENQALTEREKQVLSELEEQKISMNELKERSRKIEQALNQRIERMQEENRTISRRLGEADLEVEKLTKLRADMEETLQQKLQELQQAMEQHDRERADAQLREQELAQRFEEVDRNFQQAAAQIEQTEVSTREREASWLSRLEDATADKNELTTQLEAWRLRAESNEEALQKALSDIEDLTAQVHQLDALRAESDQRLAGEQQAMQVELDRMHAEWQRATEAWQASEAMCAALEEEQKRATGSTEGLQRLLQAEQDKVREAAEKNRLAAEQWNEQVRALNARVEQLQKQLAHEQPRNATRAQEIEALRKNLHDEQLRTRGLDQEFEKIKTAMQVEEDRVRQRDEEIAAGKKSLLEEQARRHVLEEKLLPQEKLIQDAQERIRQLEDDLQRERESIREAQEVGHLRQVEVTLQLETLQTDYRTLEARFDEAVQELEQRRLSQDDEQRQYTIRQEYLQQQLELMQQESEKLSRQYEETLGSLDQQKIRLEDELEGSRVQIEDLQHRIEQLRQENQSLSMRFEQQKKFYDEERELRRQREVELQTQRKSYQELTGTVRQKEQSAAQQRKISDETLARAHQKEEVLNRRLEQLQSDWRSTLTRLEQAERELMQFRRGGTSAAVETGAAGTEAPARRPRPELPPPPVRKAATVTRPLPPPPAPAKPRGVIPKTPPRDVDTNELPGASSWMQDDLLPASPESETEDSAAAPPVSPALKPPTLPPKPRRVVTSTDTPAPLTNTKPQIRLQ